MRPSLRDDYRALPDEDYRFSLGIARGDAASFFAPTEEHTRLSAERRHWLESAPELYAGLLPEGVPVALEFCRTFQTDTGSPAETPLQALCRACQTLEPDVVLLRSDGQGRPITVGGCVCFPSAWSLPEKLGLSVSEVHDVVPGLNGDLERSIGRFLEALKPGVAWLRSNWGASSSPDRNQHPQRNIPAIQQPLDPDQVWLRREHQILFRLPESGGIVFGIRLDHTRMSDVLSSAPLSARWARGLRTMSPEMLRYKRLDHVCAELVQRLSSAE